MPPQYVFSSGDKVLEENFKNQSSSFDGISFDFLAFLSNIFLYFSFEKKIFSSNEKNEWKNKINNERIRTVKVQIPFCFREKCINPISQIKRIRSVPSKY